MIVKYLRNLSFVNPPIFALNFEFEYPIIYLEITSIVNDVSDSGVYSKGDFMVHLAGLNDKKTWIKKILRDIEEEEKMARKGRSWLAPLMTNLLRSDVFSFSCCFMAFYLKPNSFIHCGGDKVSAGSFTLSVWTCFQPYIYIDR